MKLDYDLARSFGLLKKYPNIYENLKLCYHSTYRRPSIQEIRKGIYFEYVHVQFNHTCYWKEGRQQDMRTDILQNLYDKYNLRTNMVLMERDDYKKLTYVQTWQYNYYKKQHPNKVRLATKEQLNKFLEDKPMTKEITTLSSLSKLLQEGKSLEFQYNGLEIVIKTNTRRDMTAKYDVYINGIDQYKLPLSGSDHDKWFSNKNETMQRQWRWLIELNTPRIASDKDVHNEKAYLVTLFKGIFVEKTKQIKGSTKDFKKALSIGRSRLNRKIKKFQSRNIYCIGSIVSKDRPAKCTSFVIHPTIPKVIKPVHIKKLCLRITDENKIIRILEESGNELIKSNPDKYEIVSRQTWKAWKRDYPKTFNTGFHMDNAGKLGIYTGMSRNVKRGSFKNVPGNRLLTIQRVPILVRYEDDLPVLVKKYTYKTIKIYNTSKSARGIKLVNYKPRKAKQTRNKEEWIVIKNTPKKKKKWSSPDRKNPFGPPF